MADHSLYFSTEDYPILSEALGFADPHLEGEGESPSKLTPEEARTTENENFAETAFTLAETYNAEHPLTAADLTRDPYLVQLVGRRLEEKIAEFSGTLAPDLLPQEFDDEDLNQVRRYRSAASPLFTEMTVDVTDIRENLPKEFLDQLEGKEEISEDLVTLRILSEFFQEYLKKESDEAPLIIKRSDWDTAIESYNASSGKDPVSATKTWEELLAIWGAEVEKGPWWLNAVIPNKYGQADLAPARVSIKAKGLKRYFKDPTSFQKVLIDPYPNTGFYEVDRLASRATVTFPALSINLNPAILGDGWASDAADYVGAGVFLDVDDGAKATAFARIENGQILWDPTWPMIRLEGFSLRIEPQIMDPLPLLGVIPLQNKIVLVAQRTREAGKMDPLGQDYFFFDFTKQVYLNLCMMDPPIDCPAYRRVKDVVFTSEGDLRDEVPLHELQVAIIESLKRPAYFSSPSGNLSAISSQVPLDQLREELYVPEFSAHYQPRLAADIQVVTDEATGEAEFKRVENREPLQFGSLVLTTAEIQKARVEGLGTLPGDFLLHADVPMHLAGQMEVDGESLEIDVVFGTKVVFDTKTGFGSVKIELNSDDVYSGHVEVIFSLPNITKQPLDYSAVLKEALFRVTAEIVENHQDRLIIQSVGRYASQAGWPRSFYELMGEYGIEAKGEIDPLKGMISSGHYYGVSINDTNRQNPFTGIGITSDDLLIKSGLAALLGEDVVVAVYQDHDGSFHLLPHARVKGTRPDGNGNGTIDDGEIVLTPNFEEGFSTVEFKEVRVHLDRAALRTEKGDFFGETEATLTGSWTIQGGSPVDLFKPQNWIGSGELALLPSQSHLEFKGPHSGMESGGEIAATIASGNIVTLEITDLAFENPDVLSGRFESGFHNTDVRLDWGDFHLSGRVQNAGASLSGTVIPRAVITIAEKGEEEAGAIVEEPPTVFKKRTLDYGKPFQHMQEVPEPDLHTDHVEPALPPPEVLEPRNLAEKVTLFFQELVKFAPSVEGFEVKERDILIGAHADYVEGEARIPLLKDRPGGLKAVVLEGTRVDEEETLILAKEGRLEEFVIKLNQPISVLGIRIRGLHLKTRSCSLKKRDKHVLVVDTSLGKMNLLCLLSLIGNQFKPCQFYRMLRKEHGIKLRRNSIPRDLEELGIFFFELFRLYGDQLDTLQRSAADETPPLISFVNTTEFSVDYALNLKPARYDLNNTHIDVDDRERETIHGEIVWRPNTKASEGETHPELKVSLANAEGEVVDGVFVEVEGDRGFSGKFERVGQVNFYLAGDKKHREFEVTTGAAHVDDLSAIHTPKGEEVPLFHVVSGVDTATGEHSFIDVSSLRVARVREESGEFHSEIETVIQEAKSPYGHVEFSQMGRSGRYDFSGARITDLKVEIISKSFPPGKSKDPAYRGFERIFVDGELDHEANPSASEENPWLVLDLGKDRHLVFQKLSTTRGHFHVEMKEGEIPITYSGLLEILMDVPDDPRLKVMEERGITINLSTISVKGPALAELDGPVGGIRYMKMDDEELEHLEVTVTGEIRFPYQDAVIELDSITVPLRELLVEQIPNPEDPTDEIPSIKKLVLDPIEVSARIQGILTSPPIQGIGARRVSIAEGSLLVVKTGGETRLAVSDVNDWGTMSGSADDLSIALMEPRGSGSRKVKSASVNAGKIEINEGEITIDDWKVWARLREAIYRTLLSLHADGTELSLSVDEELLKSPIPIPPTEDVEP